MDSKCMLFLMPYSLVNSFFLISIHVFSDGVLRKREFRDFRVSVRNSGWPARNRACARNFWHYCDLDSDSALTKTEFRTCLGIDINSEFSLQDCLEV